jgi:hypothetical protein
MDPSKANSGAVGELADGWDTDEDPMSDRPFAAYYHWCPLLCAFGEAPEGARVAGDRLTGSVRHDCAPGARSECDARNAC